MSIPKQCPSCGETGVDAFYDVSGVPVESSIVLETAREALSFPTGDVVLGFCDRCGFITNLVYPDTLQPPRAAYEDQQGFSPTFSSFAGRMAAMLVERYRLRGRTIVEIGCGKGDFLALLCEGNDNRGVGIDPLFRADRLPREASERITVVPETYAVEHARFQPDLIVCRHTLEHIPDTRRMLETIRSTLDDARDTDVVIEVPDVVRVLEEGAFWDVYYEHCSYFSPGSMARGLRLSGYEVTDLQREYDGQYLIAHARANRGIEVSPPDIEESPADLRARVHDFSRRVERSRSYWQERVGDAPVIWGSGSKCVAFATTLGIAARVAGVVDINPHRHGLYMPGISCPISGPEALSSHPPAVVVAMNPVYRDEIEATVRALGLDTDVIAVG